MPGLRSQKSARDAGVPFHLIVFEQDILRTPDQLKPWLRYIEYKKQHGTLLDQCFVLERACNALPRSYKVWKMYLQLRIKHLKNKNPGKFACEFHKVNALFERALILLNKMPRIWSMYLSFLMKQPLITACRRTFDRALRALPVLQHQRLWSLMRPFLESASGKTTVKLWRRYVQLYPEHVEDYIDVLVDQGEYTDAARRYIRVLNDPKFQSKHGRSTFQIWTELLDLLVAHASTIDTGYNIGINVDRIVRSGLQRFPDQRGKLWTGLATYWIMRGRYEQARDIFEEGITTVMTVRDFTIIFDSYVLAEETLISSLMEEAKKGPTSEAADHDLDVRMLKFEQLMDRRPFLVNDVLLRQNPNAIGEWEKRVKLWGDNTAQVVQTYTDAIATVQPRKAVGRFHKLFLDYAKLYAGQGDMKTARIILEKATRVPFRSVAELAETWCGWAELELAAENFDQAMNVMAKATQASKRSSVDYFDETLSPQQRVHKSWKLWSFYVDLVESVSTLEETRKVYDRIFELRIATPQTVVNYANLLEENEYFEQSFKIYERGLDLFKYPVAFELWNLYLSKAVDRRISIERLRDLFEQAVEGCPPKFAKPLYLMYGQLEDERGLARHAMRIYEQATRAVSDEDRLDMFTYYITKSAANFGLTSTRPIYQRAIEVLADRDAKEMCIQFAEMERRLGEIDRARAIFGHGSQFSDPRTNPTYWQKWEAFEVQHGNEDTFKEMLRVKRSVQAKYNTDINYIASQALSRQEPKTSTDAMEALEQEAKAPVGFVPASTGLEGGPKSPPPAPANPDALDVEVD